MIQLVDGEGQQLGTAQSHFLSPNHYFDFGDCIFARSVSPPQSCCVTLHPLTRPHGNNTVFSRQQTGSKVGDRDGEERPGRRLPSLQTIPIFFTSGGVGGEVSRVRMEKGRKSEIRGLFLAPLFSFLPESIDFQQQS